MKEREERDMRIPSSCSHLQGGGPVGRDSHSPVLLGMRSMAKPGAVEWLSTKFFTSAANHWLYPEMSSVKEAELYLWLSPRPQGMGTGQDPPCSAVHPPV